MLDKEDQTHSWFADKNMVGDRCEGKIDNNEFRKDSCTAPDRTLVTVSSIKKKSQQAIDKQTNKKGKEQTNVTDLLCVNGSTDERLEYYELEVVN